MCPVINRSRSQAAFTLVELLLCVVIIGALALLVGEGASIYRERMRGVQCMTQLRGMGAALQIYAAESDSHLPSLTPDNVELAASDSGKGALDIRYELIQYDSALWNMVCPSDPLTRQNPDAKDPTYVSYLYLPESGLDLAQVRQPVCLMRDSGFYHGSPGDRRSTLLYSDQHLEMQKWQ